MPAGRPTNYTPELLEKAKEYVAQAVTEALANSPEGGLPSIAELALYLDVNRDTLYEWGKQHEDFSDILKKLLTAQEMRLTDNGLSGKWNSTITKLMLTKHGYTDKQDITSDGKAIPTPILNGISTDERNEEDSEVKE